MEDTRFDDIHIKLLSFRDGVIFEFSDLPRTPHLSASARLSPVAIYPGGEFIVNGVRYSPGTLIDFPERQPYEVSVPNGANGSSSSCRSYDWRRSTDPSVLSTARRKLQEALRDERA